MTATKHLRRWLSLFIKMKRQVYICDPLLQIYIYSVNQYNNQQLYDERDSSMYHWCSDGILFSTFKKKMDLFSDQSIQLIQYFYRLGHE